MKAVGYDSSTIVERPCYKFKFSTWESFRNPYLNKNSLLSQILKQNVGTNIPCENLNFDILQKILVQLKNKLVKRNWPTMVKEHCLKSKNFHDNSAQNMARHVHKKCLVTLFRAIGSELLPSNLFGNGNKQMIKQIIKNMNILLTTPSKRSPILLRQLCKNIVPSHIPWIAKISKNTTVRETILAKVLSWLAKNVFWRAITGFFFIMDTSFAKNELYFAPKRNIHSMITRILNEMTSQKHMKLIQNKKSLELILCQCNAPAVAKCRLLLKKCGGSRLICMKKKLLDDAAVQNIQNKKDLLQFVANLYPGMVDVKGLKFHSLWSRFVKQVKDMGSTRIYIVVADIRDAYGSVSHEKLVSILNKLRNKLPQYLYIHNISYTYPNSTKFRVFRRRIPSKDQYIDPMIPSNSVIYKRQNETLTQSLNVSEVIKSISQRIKLHTLQFCIGKKKKHFLLNNGLVQGDILSVPLCNIYYGDMVRKHMNEFASNDNRSTKQMDTPEHVKLFARGMDDFIFATTDKNEANRFAERINRGFPDYGCKIRKDKFKTNIGDSEPYSCKTPIVFCGAVLDPVSLSCKPDFSTYMNRNIAYASTFNTHSFADPQAFILKKMLFLVSLKMQALYLDESFNGRKIVIENAFEMYYVSALRFHSLVDSLIFSNGRNVELDYLQTVIGKCSCKISQLYNRICKNLNSANQSISTNEIKYLFMLAFKMALSRKSGAYGKNIFIYFNCELIKYKLKEIKELNDIANSVLKTSGMSTIISHAYQKIL